VLTRYCFVFSFSSRRRHTRSKRDWSSDVCSSDLKKPLREAIPGESLNLLIGSRPFKDDEGGDRVKLAVMELLNQKYGIVEEDFISAELEVVPAFKAPGIGFDRSLIGAYGHDDRVCG